MNKYRKKYQNVVERKNHLSVISRDHNTIDSLESQALDAFFVEASSPEYYMQRMGQLFIKPMNKRRYNLEFYQNQAKMIFPGTPRKLPTATQSLDRFIIKPKQKPKNIIQKPVHFNINQKPKKIIFKEEQLDSFICAKKEKPKLKLQNVHNVLIKKDKKINNTIESLNNFKLPATGKFFNNHPVLKSINILEIEYLKIKAPLKCSSSTSLLIPLKPKKIKFTDIQSENSANLKYIINKVKVFSPSATSVKNTSTLLIPKQPKKTSFTGISPNKETDFLFELYPKKTSFDEITIENFPDIFIQEQPKKRYYSTNKADSMSIMGETPLFCLEIDPNEEIFIPNVYDMLLIQNFWDDLSIRSFRICLRPKGYVGFTSKNLEIVSNKNLLNLNENSRSKSSEDSEENEEEKEEKEEKEKKEENEKKEEKDEKEKDKDINLDKDDLKDFRNKNKEINNKNKIKEEIDTNIYEDRRGENEENKDSLNEPEKPKENNKKGHRFRDLKKKLLMINNDE